jgi:hypothetical protein
MPGSTGGGGDVTRVCSSKDAESSAPGAVAVVYSATMPLVDRARAIEPHGLAAVDAHDDFYDLGGALHPCALAASVIDIDRQVSYRGYNHVTSGEDFFIF